MQRNVWMHVLARTAPHFFVHGIPSSVMGMFYSKPSTTNDIVVVSQQPQVHLPVDVYTCILEFLIDTNDMANDSIATFRLISKSTKLAFEKRIGWAMIHAGYQDKRNMLSRKIQILQATIADPPLLECILKFDAYLTCCWTLKNELSLQRHYLEQEVLVHLARLKGEETSADESAGSGTTQQQLILISEWGEGDECILKFEPVENTDLHGFMLPAIDQSELPFLLA